MIHSNIIFMNNKRITIIKFSKRVNDSSVITFHQHNKESTTIIFQNQYNDSKWCIFHKLQKN